MFQNLDQAFAGQSAFGSGLAGLENELQQLEQAVEQLVEQIQGLFPLNSQFGGSGGNLNDGQSGLSGYTGNPGGCAHGHHHNHFADRQSTPWTATTNGNGQATLDTGRYSVQCNKSNSGFTVTDDQTGQMVMNVSGDPHFSANGQNFTFKGDTSFDLPDGTKLTVRTVPYGNGQTLSDELDITRGNQSMRVTGLAQTNNNPLQIAEGFDGYGLAASNFGDPALYDIGGQWRAWDGQVVDAAYAAANL